MLSIAAARERVLAAVPGPLPDEEVAIDAALGRVLADDVTAAGDVPPFPNSAMDGFAVRAGEAGRSLRVAGESRAGAPAGHGVGEGEAIRISTGAVVPEGAEAVIRVEDTAEEDGAVWLHAAVLPGQNLRAPGEDVRAGERVLTAGVPLGPVELGVAVAAGRGTVACPRRPRVAVLATGDELVPPGARLRLGQIHNTNEVTLSALADRAGAEVRLRRRVADDRAATQEALAAALEEADLVAVSGGVSVGPHDHVKPALEGLGVREAFWRVALQPGKPTWFGTGAGGRLVLGLPGNPVSAVVCFHLFAAPALRALQGLAALPRRERVRLAEPASRKDDREQALRVRVRDGHAEPTGAQGSHRLSSLLGADALAFVPPGAGEVVEVEVEWL